MTYNVLHVGVKKLFLYFWSLKSLKLILLIWVAFPANFGTFMGHEVTYFCWILAILVYWLFCKLPIFAAFQQFFFITDESQIHKFRWKTRMKWYIYIVVGAQQDTPTQFQGEGHPWGLCHPLQQEVTDEQTVVDPGGGATGTHPL